MLKYTLLATSLFFLSGCESWGDSARVNPQTIAVYPGSEGKARNASGQSEQACPLTNGLYDSNRGSINLDCFQFPEFRADKVRGILVSQPAVGAAGETQPSRVVIAARDATPVYAYDMAAGTWPYTNDEPGAIASRNRLSAVLIKHADDVCVVEKGRLVATEASSNFILSFLTTALAGASTLVGGQRAAEILAGGAVVTSSTQDNVNATFYRNQLTQAINKAIDTERGRVMTNIVTARAKTLKNHNVDEMIRLVNEYHQSCSFERGLQLLLDAALDTSGANAVLETRSRNRSLNELDRHVRYLEKAVKDDPEDTRLAGQLKEARDELHGLRLANIRNRTSNPTAADTVADDDDGDGDDDDGDGGDSDDSDDSDDSEGNEGD